MKIITCSESTINIDDNGTTTIIIPVKPPVALKISPADQLAMLGETLKILAKQSEVPKEIVKIIRENITEKNTKG